MGVSVGSLNQQQSVILRNTSTNGDAAKKISLLIVHEKRIIIKVSKLNNMHVYTVY